MNHDKKQHEIEIAMESGKGRAMSDRGGMCGGVAEVSGDAS